MMHIVNGDLLTSDCTVIMHQANCLSSMGAGIAKTICELYPEVLEADVLDARSPKQKLGSFSYAVLPKKKLIIGNLYGQLKHFGTGTLTNYQAFENATRLFLTELRSIKTTHKLDGPEKIGVPFGIGCGLAKGKWNIVSHILESVSSQMGKDIWVYRLPERQHD